jgi:hypothetical protein
MFAGAKGIRQQESGAITAASKIPAWAFPPTLALSEWRVIRPEQADPRDGDFSSGWPYSLSDIAVYHPRMAWCFHRHLNRGVSRVRRDSKR